MTNRLSRRSFLHYGAAAVTGTVVVGQVGAPHAAPLRATTADFDLEELTVAQLQDAMRTGARTSRSICAAYLARIAALDSKLHAVLETNPETLAIADRLDAERKAGKLRGPLHGIPVLVKDNIATGDRMMTTAGSLALAGSTPPRDAPLVARLRAAGAVILGKTNLSEWANIRSNQSSSGWSARGGQCANPYALDRNPCGSSSGTGAAIAASFATVGVGTETDGSIVCPSSACSLVGVKPTLGLIEGAGIIPIAHSQDTAGPMARTVADASALLGALSGHDYSASLDPNGLRGARIGVARKKFFGYSPEADALVEAAIGVLKGQGAVIVDPADIPHAGEYDDSELIVLLYELKADLATYLAQWAPTAPVKSLADVIAFNDAHKTSEMLYFGQELFLQAQGKGPLTDQAYRDALAKDQRLSRTEGLDVVFAQQNLDAIVAPTGSPPWPTDLVNGDHFLGASSTPAAVAGYPSVAVPVGYSFGLPVGMSFIGKANSEATLLKLAYAYEQAAKPRRAPRFLPTADLTSP
ncbi:MAG: amidase [Gemmatimonadetes bacterium 13_2_20CM_2_65_7]|nr:MAG: amidase [Gemmatimonadetes bacterium 13_2_20CM_2_65_7]OLC40342.1 MAG: amidase [Gemmatimonadetes bacterium 13_1_40CM_4_65_7]